MTLFLNKLLAATGLTRRGNLLVRPRRSSVRSPGRPPRWPRAHGGRSRAAGRRARWLGPRSRSADRTGTGGGAAGTPSGALRRTTPDALEPADTVIPTRPAAYGRFASSFTGATGTRSFKLFEPGGCDGRALPLLVMLHGCTQDPDDFAAGTRMNEHAQAQGLRVLYPAQAPRSNAHECWNWFVPATSGAAAASRR